MSGDALLPSGSGLPVLRDGYLPVALRRGLADLNVQYLALGLCPEFEADLRFGWSDAVRQRLLAADARTRERIASLPVALFEVTVDPLPAIAPALRIEDGGTAVDDGPRSSTDRCTSFLHQVAFLAWRLVDATPLAARVTLGLSAAAQARLGDLRPSQLAEIALRPNLIRPRWPAHDRYWSMLVAAARGTSETALEQALCVGVCLFGAEHASVAAATPAPARRRPRR